MERLLEFRHVSKSYGGTRVLTGMDLTFDAGEILCLVGENGAGKSTMIKILSGAIAPDDGEIRLFGSTYARLHPRQAIKLGVATIYQEIDLVDNLTVADNVFLGEELMTGLKTVNRSKQERITQQLLSDLNIHRVRADMMVSELSTGQKQSLQIVKALKHDAKILILDEPTASLGEEETAALLALIQRLAAKGMGIIFISHYLDEIFRIGTRVIVLKDGVKISDRPVAETTVEQMVHDMIGREASSFYHRAHFPLGEGVLEIRNFCRGNVVKNVSFSMREGEIFGLGGLVGAGRTELVRMVYGADPNKSGHVVMNGKDITPSSPRDAVQKGIFMISEDRKGTGLFLQRSVRENIMVTTNEKQHFISLHKERSRVDESVRQLQIRVSSPEQAVETLSGGNQQKVVIARCLQDEGKLYIFDEPTKGVDVGAKEEIYRHMLELARQHNYVIMVSSSMPELISMSDRIGVMREGELVDIVEAAEATEDGLLKAFIGIKNTDRGESDHE